MDYCDHWLLKCCNLYPKEYLFYIFNRPLNPYQGGHDRDVNNAINQGGTAGASDRTNGKSKRREIRPRGTLEISHENPMEISWKNHEI